MGTDTQRMTRSPLTLYRAGREATAAIPGMRGRAIRAVLANFLLFIVLMAVINGLSYFLMLGPVRNWGLQLLPDNFDFLAEMLFWFSSVTLVLLSLYLALRLSFALMGLWYERLVEAELCHLRPGFDAIEGGIGLGATVGIICKEVVIFFCLILLNLVPVVGSLLTFLWTAHRMGLSLYEPYRAVLREHQLADHIPVVKFLGMPTLVTGLFQLLIALVPVLGWMLLWWINLHMVLGVAWRHGRSLPEIGQLFPSGIPATPAGRAL